MSIREALTHQQNELISQLFNARDPDEEREIALALRYNSIAQSQSMTRQRPLTFKRK